MKKILSYLILVMALGMATTVAYVSISGLLKVFAGAGLVGLILFSSIEAAKIVATSAIHTYGKKIGWLYNSILSLFIFIAMVITSMGIYGFLASSYKETFTKFENLETTIELLDKKRDGYEKQLEIVNNEKESLNKTISELSKGLSNNVIQYKDKETGQIITTTSSSTRRVLQKQLDRHIERQDELNKKSENLSDKVFETDSEITEVKLGNDAGSELGPLRYLSDITGMSMDEVMKYFIILLIIIGDPMAVVMVIVFNKIVKRDDEDEPYEVLNVKTKKVDSNKKMKTDINPEDITEELENVLGNDDLTDYDTDIEIEYEDEIEELNEELSQINPEIVKEPKDKETKSTINIEDIKEIKEKGLIAPTIKKYNNEVNRIGSNKEVRNGDTNKLYFKKRRDGKP